MKKKNEWLRELFEDEFDVSKRSVSIFVADIRKELPMNTMKAIFGHIGGVPIPIWFDNM
jgi:transposase